MYQIHKFRNSKVSKLRIIKLRRHVYFEDISIFVNTIMSRKKTRGTTPCLSHEDLEQYSDTHLHCLHTIPVMRPVTESNNAGDNSLAVRNSNWKR